MEETYRYCWLKMPEGKFSNSWSQETHDTTLIDDSSIDKDNWKLIKYACVNDQDFEFMNQMKMK